MNEENTWLKYVKFVFNTHIMPIFFKSQSKLEEASKAKSLISKDKAKAAATY